MALQTHVRSLRVCKLHHLLPSRNHIRKASAKAPPQLREYIPLHTHSYLFIFVIHSY